MHSATHGESAGSKTKCEIPCPLEDDPGDQEGKSAQTKALYPMRRKSRSVSRKSNETEIDMLQNKKTFVRRELKAGIKQKKVITGKIIKRTPKKGIGASVTIDVFDLIDRLEKNERVEVDDIGIVFGQMGEIEIMAYLADVADGIKRNVLRAVRFWNNYEPITSKSKIVAQTKKNDQVSSSNVETYEPQLVENDPQVRVNHAKFAYVVIKKFKDKTQLQNSFALKKTVTAKFENVIGATLLKSGGILLKFSSEEAAQLALLNEQGIKSFGKEAIASR